MNVMNKALINKALVRFAGAGTVAVMLASPAFAATRGVDDGRSDRGRNTSDARVEQSRRGTNDNQSNRNDQSNRNIQSNRNDQSNRNIQSNRNDQSYRENQRVNATGRITAFSRERDGYRVQLDRGGNFWVPESRIRNHSSNLRVGISIGLGGIFRGGSINVDAVSWPGDNGGYDYGNGGYGNQQTYVRGVVQGIDFRRDVMTLRDDASGRLIDVDLRGTERTSRLDANDLRRGDYVTVSGDWLRGGNFNAYRIESVRTR
jgi:hypothetical protein